MAKQSYEMGPNQHIYFKKDIASMKDYPASSFSAYNKAVFDLIYDMVFNNQKISPLTKAEINDTLYIKPAQSVEIKKVLNLLQKNVKLFDDYQVRRNFATFVNFNGNSCGSRLINNLGDLNPPRVLAWEKVVKELLNPNFNFENSELLENWVLIGEQIDNAFQRLNNNM